MYKFTEMIRYVLAGVYQKNYHTKMIFIRQYLMKVECVKQIKMFDNQ